MTAPTSPAPVTVTALDPHDDEGLAAYHALAERAERAACPWKPGFHSLDEWRHYFRTPVADQRNDLYVARTADGTIVGGGGLNTPLLDNLDKTWAIASVDPAHERRGGGSALVEYAVDLATRLGRTVVTAMIDIPAGSPVDGDDEGSASAVSAHPRVAWLIRRGWTPYAVDRYSQLHLPTPPGHVRELAHAAARHHAAYEIVTFRDTIPQELQAGYCAVQNQLILDAPTGELDYEEEALTPEAWAERNARSREMGRHNYVSLALLHGEVVGQTDVFLSPDGSRGIQTGTTVARTHRGHRLGLALKCANLAAIEADHPECRVIDTNSNDANAPMHAVNEALGYRPVALSVQLARRLEPARG